MKQHKLLSIHFIKFEVDSRYRIKLGLYLLTYPLCITFSISKSYHMVIVTNAKHNVPPSPLAKAETLFSQLLGRLTSSCCFLS